MEISRYSAQTSFGIKFYNNNNALREVIEYAAAHDKLPYLDGALNSLSNVKGGDILIVHGQRGNTLYSSFTLGRNSIRNEVKGCESFAEATYNAIIELLDKDSPKLMQLLKRRVKRNFYVEDMVKKYSA